MNIHVKTETNNLYNGLQLIQAKHHYRLIGLANVDFLDKTATIEEYEEWGNQNCMTFLPLNRPTIYPQTIKYSSFDIVYSVTSTVNYLKTKYKIEHYNNFNFQTLLNRLYNIENKDGIGIGDYESCIFNYYDELFLNQQ